MMLVYIDGIHQNFRELFVEDGAPSILSEMYLMVLRTILSALAASSIVFSTSKRNLSLSNILTSAVIGA